MNIPISSSLDLDTGIELTAAVCSNALLNSDHKCHFTLGDGLQQMLNKVFRKTEPLFHSHAN